MLQTKMHLNKSNNLSSSKNKFLSKPLPFNNLREVNVHFRFCKVKYHGYYIIVPREKCKYSGPLCSLTIVLIDISD